MKLKFSFLALLILPLIISITSCEQVDRGCKGTRITWDGKVDTTRVYPEGVDWGMTWLWDDLVSTDIRERTKVVSYNIQDTTNMTVPIELSVDFTVMPEAVSLRVAKIIDFDLKFEKVCKSAILEILPKYRAESLNLEKRPEAETKILKLLTTELSSLYVRPTRVSITDIDLPKEITDAAKARAEQAIKNKAIALRAAAAASIANEQLERAKGNYEAAKYNAQANALLSSPAMLELKRLDIQMEYAKQGVSPYGNNNVFGSGVNILRTQSTADKH